MRELGLPAGVDPGLALRDVVASYGIEVTAVRDAVQRHQDSNRNRSQRRF